MSGLVMSLSQELVCEQGQMNKTGVKQTLYCQPQDKEDNIVEIRALIYTPPAMIVRKENNLEQLSRDWEKYINGFKAYLEATEVAGHYAEPKVAVAPCAACVKFKQLLTYVGGVENYALYNCFRLRHAYVLINKYISIVDFVSPKTPKNHKSKKECSSELMMKTKNVQTH